MAMISGILSLVGGIVSGVAAYQSNMYAAQVAQNNATIANENAQYVREAGMQQAINQSMAGAAKDAQIVTAIAANNVDVNQTGSSAVAVEEGQREVNKEDTLTTENNAQWRAFGYTTQAYNFQAQSQQDKMAAQAGLISGILGGASALPGIFGGGGGGGGGVSDVTSSGTFAAPGSSPVDPSLTSAGSGGVIPTYGTYNLPYGGGVISGM